MLLIDSAEDLLKILNDLQINCLGLIEDIFAEENPDMDKVAALDNVSQLLGDAESELRFAL